MAYHKPQNIDDFVLLMAKADMRVKAQLAEDLVVYLSDMENSIVSNDLGLLVDNLMPWLIGSHFKVSLLQLLKFSYISFSYANKNKLRFSVDYRLLPLMTDTSCTITNITVLFCNEDCNFYHEF